MASFCSALVAKKNKSYVYEKYVLWSNGKIDNFLFEVAQPVHAIKRITYRIKVEWVWPLSHMHT